MRSKIKYNVDNIGKNTILLTRVIGDDQNSNPSIRRAEIRILFDTDPVSVMKYGPNGLHLAEHYLWRMINAKSRLMNTNASTHGSGAMAVYGECLEEDLTKTLSTVYNSLIKLWTKGLPKFGIEQMRVSSETADLHERSKSDWRMFTFNPDIFHGAFPDEYLWNILAHECKLIGISVTADCGIDVGHLRELVGKLDSTTVLPEHPIKLPLFYAPPFSMFKSTMHNNIYKLTSIKNPIHRIIISARLGNIDYDYYMLTCNKTKRAIVDSNDIILNMDALINYRLEQFWFTRFVVSCPNGSEAEINDLINMSLKKMFAKYKDSANKEFDDLIGT